MEEAEENISSAEIAIQQKFDEKLREEETKNINDSLPSGIEVEAIHDQTSKESQKNNHVILAVDDLAMSHHIVQCRCRCN